MNPVARIALLLASAAALPFAFEPVGQSWILYFSFGALLFCLHELKPAAAMLAGFWWGFATFGIGASWFWNIFGPTALGLFGILACFPAAFGWLSAHATRRGWDGLPLALFIGINWTALEFIRGEIFWLKFPWFGTYGITLILATGIAGLVHCRRWNAVVPALLPLIPFAPHSLVGGTRIVCIQAEGASLEQLIELSRSATDKPAHFVWPEYAIPTDLAKAAPRDLATIQKFLRDRSSTLTLGTQTFLEGAAWQNLALTLDGTQILGAHAKNHTVHLFDDGTPGTTAEPIRIGDHLVGTPVCFDCDFQDVVRRMTAAGADYFVAPTMDAISWTERQHLQHGQLFQARAVENGRWIAVAASSGLTQVIDSQGSVRSQLPLIKPGALRAELLPLSHMTFFTRVGWLIPWIVLGIWACTLLGVVFRRPQSTSSSVSA